MKLRTILPFLAIGAVGAAGWTWWNDAPAKANLPPSAPQAVPVDTATATRQDVPITLTGLGTVQALNTVTVTARVDGQIQKIAFTEGQDVKAGDLLAQIDAKRRFDKKYGLAPLWALTAPIAWVVCGVMALNVTRQIMTGQRTAWKGRQIPRQERIRRAQIALAPLLIARQASEALHKDCVVSGGSDDEAAGSA